VHGALIRYRIIAWIVGVVLLVLVLVAMPVKYLGHNDALVAIGRSDPRLPVHGLRRVDVRSRPARAVAVGPDGAGHARRHDPIPVVLGRAQSEPFLDSGASQPALAE
jgi:hypothetical protein